MTAYGNVTAVDPLCLCSHIRDQHNMAGVLGMRCQGAGITLRPREEDPEAVYIDRVRFTCSCRTYNPSGLVREQATGVVR